MLNFEEFAMEVKENLKEYLPEKYENSKIVVKDVEKCNGTRKGIVIMPEEVTGTNIAPNLYLEKYYDDYLGGEELSNVMEAIASDYARADKDIDVSMLYEVMDDRDLFLSCIIPQVINTERNEGLLRNALNRPFNDMSVVYKIKLASFDDGMATVTVTDNIAEKMNVTEQELFEHAMENLTREGQISARSMMEVMKDMMGEDFPIDDMLEEGPPMYVVTTADKQYGAAGMLDTNTLDYVCEKMEEDVYILPSSIHEIICVPKSMGDVEYFADMVQSVNSEQVAPDEFLSDNVYSYSTLDKVVKQETGLDRNMDLAPDNESRGRR